MGILYIVATPLGNLKDITLRAIEVLQTVDVIACEDTRKTGLLLQKVFPTDPNQDPFITRKNRPELLSYYEENEWKKIPEVITLLKNDRNVALVSDAGTPTISDPGFKLVRECIQEGIRVESIPGPTAIISALVSSGLPTDKFLFLGFLPRKEGNRKKLLENVQISLKAVKSTVIFFEAPHRVVKVLKELLEIFGNREIVIVRELTKVYEEIRREKISFSIEHFEKSNPKGEFVILFHFAVSSI